MCDAVGVFTTNQVQASCVVISKEHLAKGKAQAIIANSGNANCMTGKAGFKHSQQIVRAAAQELDIAPEHVCIASTGIIGKPLPIRKILDAIPELTQGLSKQGSARAAAGIMTTDRIAKEVALEFPLGGKTVRIGAIAKGAGMIHPEMALPATGKHATMLCFVTTDASIGIGALRSALQEAVQNSFNLITIDRDMSTNDMVLVLANGAAQNKRIEEGTKDYKTFTKVLGGLFLALAKLMVRDAEGATKFVEIEVKGAETPADAGRISKGFSPTRCSGSRIIIRT